jgi:hypothetical protein
MTSFFRKLRWLTRHPSKEAELQEELQFHLEEEAGECQSARAGERRGAPCGPPRVGKPRSNSGGHARLSLLKTRPDQTEPLWEVEEPTMS